ncbi:expressed unknown protein [Seminavis robusta]|uniref:Uncharacterized protein n=1 Tax=Seminavis robusta TaxID=568900 RepID=A0A9N8EB47_9STRA|nr:expressed unknown protein [Seminavis robusta]|eukprot:Sro755_g197600.1 n/a (243) ;mRNA; f:12369-13377
MTFDGLKYDCQGTGEFVILKSETRPDFEIQGRFVKFVPERKPTVTKSVVIQAGSKVPRIQVNVPSSAKNGLCTPYEYLNKVKRDIAGLDEGQASFQTEVVVSGTTGETLFTYDEDLHESFDAFEDCGAEGDGETIVYVEKEQTNQKSELSKICGDDYACYVDGCTGTKEDAQKLIESDNEEADYMCAEQIEFEDFGPRPLLRMLGISAEQDNAFGSPFLRLHKSNQKSSKTLPFSGCRCGHP